MARIRMTRLAASRRSIASAQHFAGELGCEAAVDVGVLLFEQLHEPPHVFFAAQ